MTKPTLPPARLRPHPIRIGTRSSPLALAQAQAACSRIHQNAGLPESRIRLHPVITTGDRIADRPLAEIGGKNLFGKELDAALLRGDIDLAVHSAKDIPGELAPGLAIVAALPREDPRDCLVSRLAGAVSDLPPSGAVGSCSPRRRAQLLHLRPDLRIEPLRGNIETRLRYVTDGSGDSTILAMAGLNRLGIRIACVHPVPTAEMLPAVSQAVIAILARDDDPRREFWRVRLSDPATEKMLRTERAFLGALHGDCRSPIAGLARVKEDRIVMEGEVLSPDGKTRVRCALEGSLGEPAAIGRELAARMRGRAGGLPWTADAARFS